MFVVVNTALRLARVLRMYTHTYVHSLCTVRVCHSRVSIKIAHANGIIFELLNDTELGYLLQESERENTKRQLKFSLRIFQEFCAALGDVEFDQLADIDLKSLLWHCMDQLLGKF